MADNVSKDTSLQSTKQMLDELDALMERMLSLPVSELDDAPANTAESVKSPSLAASLTLLDPETEMEPEAPPAAQPKSAPKSSPAVATISGPSSKQSSERRNRGKQPHLVIKPPHMPRPTVKIPEVPEVREEPSSLPMPTRTVPEPEPLTNEVVPRPIAEPKLQESAEVMPDAGPRRHSPLVRLNLAFDRTTMSLGGLGRLLRGQAGRTMLGLSGVVLLCAAIGWMLHDWLGWNWR